MKTLTIGRDASNNIVLNDNLVSRNHAQLIVSGEGQVQIKDLGSTNGTFVNGNRVNELYLNPGDVVKCAGSFLNWQQYINITKSIQYEPTMEKPISSGRDDAGGQSVLQQNQHQSHPQTVIVKGEKSMGVTILLTFLFGPLGMLYSTISGGVIMFFLGGFIFLITFGFGVFLIWPICIIWAAVATSKYNKDLGVLTR